MKKTLLANGKVKVTFELPPAVEAREMSVCGDFNDWVPGANPLKQRKDGRYSVTVTLPPGRYQYRYLLDDGSWENDWEADAYEPNEFGGDNSVVIV